MLNQVILLFIALETQIQNVTFITSHRTSDRHKPEVCCHQNPDYLFLLRKWRKLIQSFNQKIDAATGRPLCTGRGLDCFTVVVIHHLHCLLLSLFGSSGLAKNWFATEPPYATELQEIERTDD